MFWSLKHKRRNRVCRNSGTWGSPYAAKVGPTSGPTKKTYNTWTQARRGTTPSTLQEDNQALPRPQERSGWPLGLTFPGIPRRMAPVYRYPEGVWVTFGSTFRTEEDKNANMGTRRQKTWAPRRRTKPRSWSVGGVSALPPPFLKVDSDSTWPGMEEKTPRLLDAPKGRVCQ